MSGLVAACARAGAPPAGGGARAAALRAGPGEGGYGELVREAGPLALPEGFRVRAFGAVDDPMSDGRPTPIAHDGMAAFAAGSGRVRLLRNHEDRNGPTRALVPDAAYDPLGGGGVVTLELDAASGELRRDFVSLSGTTVNCAGGPTPWGSWLSCEETTVGPSHGYEQPHGYVFEVPIAADGPVDPVPLRAMGRFSHEAVAVDPASGIIYETEDRGYRALNPAWAGSGFYRFLPDAPGEPAAGGRLQAAAVTGHPELHMFRGREVGESHRVTWVDIDEPDPSGAERNPSAVFLRARERGAAVFDRLEGCWFGDGSVFFHDTRGGDARRGQVWQYRPDANGGRFVLVFESPDASLLDGPDNITVSPRGGVLMCEDGGGVQFLRGLTPDGRIFDVARNTLGDGTSEFAGATFGPRGRVLYVNIQGPTSGTTAAGAGRGVTLAIEGPWERGAL